MGESLPLGCFRSVFFFFLEQSDSPQLSSLEPIGWACAVGVGCTGAGVGKGHSRLIKSASFLAQSPCCPSRLVPLLFFFFFFWRVGLGGAGGFSESLRFAYIFLESLFFLLHF